MHQPRRKAFADLIHAVLTPEVRRQLIKLRKIAVFFFNSLRFFGDLSFKVFHEVFKAPGHRVKALADTLKLFAGGFRVHPRGKISPRDAFNPAPQGFRGTDHPAQQQGHNHKETSHRKHNDRKLNPPLVAHQYRAAFFQILLQLRELRENRREALGVNCRSV